MCEKKKKKTTKKLLEPLEKQIGTLKDIGEIMQKQLEIEKKELKK